MRPLLIGLAGMAAFTVVLVSALAQRPPAPKPEAKRADPARSLSKAASALLATLDTGQRTKTVLPFDSEERLNWHFVPRERGGLSYKEMNDAQKAAAFALLKVGLSNQGYRTATGIRRLEEVLRELEGAWRDPDLYVWTVFGTPSVRGPWGLRYEGHHLSLNWTVLDGRVIADSPQFFGANPARVASGLYRGLRVLAAEEDLARALVTSLDAAQRKAAIVSDKAPSDILTGAQRQASRLDDNGIPYRDLRPEQRTRLLALIRQHAGAQPDPRARERLEKIRKAGLDSIQFAWLGGIEPGQGHYYRIQGPTFLIEYDNIQNNANHIHTVWRDFTGDFGRDLLAEHYKKHRH